MPPFGGLGLRRHAVQDCLAETQPRSLPNVGQTMLRDANSVRTMVKSSMKSVTGIPVYAPIPTGQVKGPFIGGCWLHRHAQTLMDSVSWRKRI